jgi:hypothetical protein
MDCPILARLVLDGIVGWCFGSLFINYPTRRARMLLLVHTERQRYHDFVSALVLLLIFGGDNQLG